MLQQIFAVTLMNLRAIPQRLGASLVIVIGIAGVVGVMVALLSMAKGFPATLSSTGRPDRVIVLRGGANDELSSVIFRDQALVVRQAPGIRRGGDALTRVNTVRATFTSRPHRFEEVEAEAWVDDDAVAEEGELRRGQFEIRSRRADGQMSCEV